MSRTETEVTASAGALIAVVEQMVRDTRHGQSAEIKLQQRPRSTSPATQRWSNHTLTNHTLTQQGPANIREAGERQASGMLQIHA